MLQSIREKSQGWLAWFIVILVGFTLAVFGLKSYLQNSTTGAVAKVNGHQITPEQLSSAYERIRQQRQMQLGADYVSNPQIDSQLKSQALNQIIVSTILSNAALKQGFRVTENEVDSTLSNMPIFQFNGQFSRERFREILNNTLYTEGSFIAALNKDLLISQVQTGYTTSAFALPNEVNELIRLIGQKRDISYFIIPKETFVKNLHIPESEAQAFYQKNQNQYIIPEHVNLDYIELSLSDIAKNLHFSNAEIQQFYNDNKDSFTKPARWKIARILVRVPMQATSQQATEAQTKISTLSQRLQSGESFANVAEQFSEDTASAQQGGLVGWVTRGNISPEFEQAILTLKPGDVSPAIKTKEGFNIVKLIEAQPEELPAFNQIKDQVVKSLAQQKAQKTFADKADKLTNLTYANPNTLDIAAQELGLSIKHVGPFGPQGEKEGLAANSKILSAAFNPEVVMRGNNSDMIELNPETFVVLRVAHHQPAAIKPFSMVREEIFLTLKTQAAQHAAEQQGLNYIEQIRSGKNAKQLADLSHSSLIEKNDVGRFDTKFNSMIVNTAFHLPRPKNSKPSSAGIVLPSGDYAVIIVSNVHDGNEASFGKLGNEERRIFQEQLEHGFGEVDYQMYMTGLEKKAKVIIKANSQS